MEDFNLLTDTGKMRAVAALGKLEAIQRLVLGIVRIVFRGNYDTVIDAAMRWAERDKVPKDKV